MLPLPRFDYEAPDTLADLVDLAATPGSKLIAGGTDLLPSLKHRLFSPTVLVSLRRVPGMRDIQPEGAGLPSGGLSIGASVTLRALVRHPLVQQHYPALASACAGIATRTIQAMGTIGGNLMLDTRCIYYNQPAGWRTAIGGCLKCEGTVCHVAPTGKGCYAAHSADTAPALWLYNAEVELVSQGGTRRLPVRDLYDGADGRWWLRSQPGEVLTRVILPPPGAPVVHHKLRLRGSIDYGAVLIAVQRTRAEAHAVISAVSVAPFQVSVPIDKEAELPDLAARQARPMRTHLMGVSWRRQMVRVGVRRTLARCSG